ncbi:MAG: multidrug effflux MFS transporter [Pseudomonadota bacterium]
MTLPTDQARAAGEIPLGFLVFLALMTSVVALTIDAVLPALDTIAVDLAFEDPNARQFIVLNVLLGMGISQLVFGPMADALGRRQTALIGWGVYLAGTAMAALGPGAEWMLAGRFLQGFGAGAPRVVATTLARDLYEGRPLARVMSLVLTVFMLIPILAPLLGQGIEAMLGWQAIFALYAALALVSGGWYFLGVPETLKPEHRRPFRLAPLAAAFGEVIATRQTSLCAIAAGCVFAPFVVYLATAQQVLEELYGLGPLFPLAFSSIALAFAAATFTNSRLVMRYGMRACARVAFLLLIGTAAAGLSISALTSGPVPPLWVYLGLIALIFVGVALLFSNLTALALDPLGHLAGTASAVVNAVSSLLATGMGIAIAQAYDGTLTPMLSGFLVLGLAGYLCFLAGVKR